MPQGVPDAPRFSFPSGAQRAFGPAYGQGLVQRPVPQHPAPQRRPAVPPTTVRPFVQHNVGIVGFHD